MKTQKEIKVNYDKLRKNLAFELGRNLAFNSPSVIFKRLLRILIRDTFYLLTGKYRKERHRYDSIYNNTKPYTLHYYNKKTSSGDKILHFIGNFKTGGSSRLVVDIIEGLSDTWQHEVLTRYNPTPACYIGLNIHEVCHIYNDNQAKKIIKKMNPQTVHVHYWGEPDGDRSLWQWYYYLQKAAIDLGVKVVQNINTPVSPLFHPGISKYIFVSKFVKNIYSFEGENNQVIYPGSDFSHFRARDTKKTNEHPVIGMVYRLDDHKLKPQSIHPFIIAAQFHSTVKVLIVGGGAYEELYKAEVAKYGLTDRFEFTGYVSYDSLPEYYSCLDVFLAPVFEESFGQVTPFAMNMGIPVVAYDTGALREILDDTGIVVEQGDAEAMATETLKILKGEFSFSREASERALTLFSLEKMTDSYRKVYEELSAK